MLSDTLGSGKPPATKARFVRVVRRSGCTTMVADAEDALAIVPSSQRTVRSAGRCWHVPFVEDAETRVTVAGRMSTNKAFVAARGPWFATWIVYVRFAPTDTGSGA